MRTAGKLGANLPSNIDIAEHLQFRDYFRAADLPQPPKAFGWWGAVPSDEWGFLGNDTIGDCVIARAMHAVKYRNAIWHRAVNFTTWDAIDDYSAVTGYVPGNPATDQGTDPLAMETYLQATGVRDSTNTRHKIDGSVVLRTGDVGELALALWLFDGCSMCWDLPSSAPQQFSDGQPWTVVAGATSLGGHDTMGMGINGAGNIVCVTWGGLQAMTPQWFQRYSNLLIADFSLEALDAKGLSSRGYLKDTLVGDMALVAKA